MCLPSDYLMSSHMTRSPRPSPSLFAYCKQSNTGGGNGLETRLQKCFIFITPSGKMRPDSLLTGKKLTTDTLTD